MEGLRGKDYGVWVRSFISLIGLITQKIRGIYLHS